MSIYQTAKEFGMCPQSVHERLQKLGQSMEGGGKKWTEDDDKRLLGDYPTYGKDGRLQELAKEMERTPQWISRKARALGLTNPRRPKPWLAVWKDMPESEKAEWCEKYAESKMTATEFCKKNGLDDMMFCRMMKGFVGKGRFYEIVDKNRVNGENWQKGKTFELAVVELLTGLGYNAMRSPLSLTPADVIALKRDRKLFIQCQANNPYIDTSKSNAVFEYANGSDATPVFASRVEGEIKFWRITGQKDGKSRPGTQPLVEYSP